ncbi:MAG: hypothetical protein PHS02_02110 [Candidatus ainarchaeum sp.]|nr:hypothetical protein [Candidatus ainarchaeum sp.]
MKIPLQIIDEQIQVGAVFRAPKYRTGLALIDFVVDTGSNVSFISPRDLMKINFPQNALTFKSMNYIGGGSSDISEIHDIVLAFHDEDTNLVKIPLKTFHACTSHASRGDKRARSMLLPSVLGLDFLKTADLSLYTKPAKNIAYLERI